MESSTFLQKAIKIGFALTAVATLMLAGCGGSGSATKSSPETTTLRGTAAVGFAVANATVNIKCASSTSIASSTTNSSGAIQMNLSGQTLPCAIQVSGGTINSVANTTNYHSIATSAGNVNATPLTDLLIANLAGTATPSAWFTNLTTTQLAAITAGQVTTATTNVKTALGLTTQLAGIDPITTVFTPTNDNVMDNTLEALQAAITSNGTAYASLLSGAGASVNAGFTPPAGFNAALTSAYVAPAGGGSTAAVTGFSPTSGSVGSTVTITGTNLVLGFPPAPTVKFGVVNAGVPYTNVSNTGITFTVPAGLSAGTHTITIGGMSGTPITVGTFTVTAASVPAAPVVYLTVNSSTQITLNWPAVSGASRYTVYRSSVAGFTSAMADRIVINVAGTSYTDNTLTAATMYYYHVKAENAAGISPASTEVAGATQAVGGTLLGGSIQGAPLNLTTTVTTFAGSGIGSLDGTGVVASFNNPSGITTDGMNLYVACTGSNTIRKIEIATGVVTTLAGSGSYGAVDGTGVAASFAAPFGITTDGTNLFVADVNNGTIRKIVIATGVVSTLAGSGFFNTLDGTGVAASFKSAYGITTDGKNLYVTDYNTIRKIVIATGVVTTLAGSGIFGAADGTGFAASFSYPRGITTDGKSLYVTDTLGNTIRKIVIATGVVTTLAGSGIAGSADGTGVSASFTEPFGITTDGTNLYVADTFSNKIRKIVIATGIVTTLSGSGIRDSADGTGVAASFNNPWGIITDGTNLFVTDYMRIRKIR